GERVRGLRGGGCVRGAGGNGDGGPDLLIRAGMGNGILVALGPFKENEPIALTREIDFTPKGFVMDFAVADWDRDGRPDLLVRQEFLDKGSKHGIYWYKKLGGAGLPRCAPQSFPALQRRPRQRVEALRHPSRCSRIPKMLASRPISLTLKPPRTARGALKLHSSPPRGPAVQFN